MLQRSVSVDPAEHRDEMLTRGSSPKHATASGVERSFPSVGGPYGRTGKGVEVVSMRFALLAEESEKSCPGQVMAWHPPLPTLSTGRAILFVL